MGKYLVILKQELYSNYLESVCNFYGIEFERILGSYRYYIWCTDNEQKRLNNFDFIDVFNMGEA